MERPEFRIPLSARQEEIRACRLEALKTNPIISKWIRKNRIPDSILEAHSGRIELWLRSINECDGCLGLMYCTQPVEGRLPELSLSEEGFLEESFKPCRFAQIAAKQLAHKTKFLYSDMQGEDYRIRLEAIMQNLGGEKPSYLQAVNTCLAACNGESDALFLYGEPGSGKSYLLMAAANELARKGKTVAFVRVPALIARLKETMQDREYRRNVMRSLRQADILVLDDFGSELATPWSRDEILFPLLDERMNRHKPTFFASNLKMNELKVRYTLDMQPQNKVAAERLMDRVRALSIECALPGRSRRRSQPVKKASNGGYEDWY